MTRLTLAFGLSIIRCAVTANPLDQVRQAVTRQELIGMQQVVEMVYIHDAVYDYIARLVPVYIWKPMTSLGSTSGVNCILR